jgi:hypothetical protein
MIDWKEKVVPDYRERILVDQGSPILPLRLIGIDLSTTNILAGLTSVVGIQRMR